MHSLLRTLMAISCLGLLSSCTNSSSVTVNAVPAPEEYQNCRGSGAASISGETFAKSQGGDVKVGAGVQVHLDPATSYSGAVFRALQKAGDLHKQREADTFTFDEQMLYCRRSVTADANGHFTFSNVKAGSYFVSSYISWQTRGVWTGGWQYDLVKVKDGQQRSGVKVYHHGYSE